MELSKTILNKLISKYENSKASQGVAKRNVKISLTMTDDVFKEHRNYDEGKLEEALSILSLKKFVFVIKNSSRYERIELNLDPKSIDECYIFLNRENPKYRKEKLISYLTSLSKIDNETIQNMSSSFLYDLSEGKQKHVETYFSSLDELKKIVKVVLEVANLECEVSERVFSIKCFGDSKTLMNIKSKVNVILKEFSEEIYNDEDDPLFNLGVVSNTNYAFIKGDLSFKINDQLIDLGKYKNELALSDKMIDEIEIISLNESKIITIENLTNFLEFNEDGFIAIYLGGFHNSVKRKLLLKIREANSNLTFYHFGDIDAGGFYILNHLKEKTRINFIPFKMKVDVFINNLSRAKDLTKNDIKRLERMKDDSRFDEFKEVIEAMLKENKKLEQEALI